MPSPRVLISAALAASAASSAPAFDYAAPGAFADSLCDVSFSDASGAVLEFDLRRVAAVNVSVPGGQGYQVTACGVLQLSCSGLVQNLSPGIQLDGDACYEVLATGPPLHELRDPANAATGGLFTRFQSAWTMASDGGKCGDWSPVLGREEGRKLVIEHLCNASLAPGVVVALSSGENPECTYTLTIASAAACGVTPRAQPAPPVVNPGGPAMPPWRPNAGPFAPFLCSPILADAAAKQWRFALQQLYKSGSDYTVTTALGTFALNVCGHTATTCTPPYAIEARSCGDRAALATTCSDAQPPHATPLPLSQANFGGLVVSWANGAAPPPEAQCAWANGTATACTAPCRTLAWGAPFFSLANASDGAAGGLVMAMQSSLVYADEPATTPRCGFDAEGNPLFSSVAVAIACDKSEATLVIDDVRASVADACSFTVLARASAACGVPA